MSGAVEPTVASWAERIRPHLAQAVEGIVAAGRELLEAKAALPHGSFGPLLDELGMSPDMAQRFMKVARHPLLGNPARVRGFPAAIGTLDVLARLGEDELVSALERGEVTPSITRHEARALVDRVIDGAVTAGNYEVLRALGERSQDVWRARKVAHRIITDAERQRKAAAADDAVKQQQRDGVRQVYDIWVSPRRWLLDKATGLDANGRESQIERKHRLRDFPRVHQAGVPQERMWSGMVSRPLPVEVAQEPGAMSALAHVASATRALEQEARRRYRAETDALLEWIRDESRAAADVLRAAAESLSDEPTILVGRRHVNASGGDFWQSEAGCLPYMFGRAPMTPHEPDDCACGDAIPLGVYSRTLVVEAVS